MDYKEYLLRRFVHSLGSLFGLSILIFVIARVIPGDPARTALGKSASQEQVENLREQMGLDEPIYIQYLEWLEGVLQGDWGMSLRTNNNVLHDMISTLPATMELVFFAMCWAIPIAILLGVFAGMNKDKFADHTSRIGALAGVSMPRFWIAIVFQIIFAAWLGLFPIFGRIPSGFESPHTVTGFLLVDSFLAGQWGKFTTSLHYIILPGVALGLSTLAQVMRLLRSEMIDVSRKDYIMTAKANGLPSELIVWKYMLKNAFSSSLTIIGLQIVGLIGGAFLVELVFGWPGFARYGVNAVLTQDLNAIVGVTIFTGIGFLIMNFIVDNLYRWFDPRVTIEDDMS